MLEKDVERKSGDIAKQRGFLHLKFTSPGRAAVPDRLVLAQIPEWLRPVVAKYVRFVEYKAAGKKPTGPQMREHERLRTLGFAVDVVDDVNDARDIFEGMGDAT